MTATNSWNDMKKNWLAIHDTEKSAGSDFSMSLRLFNLDRLLFRSGRSGLKLRVIAASFLAAIALGCTDNKNGGAPLSIPPPPVTVATPVEREVTEWDEYTGHLEAVEFVEVRARVSGLIVSAPFVEGTAVKKDELLFELDARPYQADLEAKIAAEAQAGAKVDLANIDFNRIKAIPKDARTSSEFDTAAAVVKQAEAELGAAKANVEWARLNVEWCRVRAPISGRISRKNINIGNLITGGTGTGTLLTTITSVDPMYCYVDTDERAILKYQRLAREGKRVSARDAHIPCFLQLTDGTVYSHEGVVDFVDNRLDPTTGTIQGRGIFPNPDGRLIPGFFGRVRVPGSGKYRTLLIPDSAVATDQNQKYLLVAGPGDVVQRREITMGALFGDLRAVESGITTNDRVIVSGHMQALPGGKVNPHEISISMDTFQRLPTSEPTTQAAPTDHPTPTTQNGQGAASSPLRTAQPTTRNAS